MHEAIQGAQDHEAWGNTVSAIVTWCHLFRVAGLTENEEISHIFSLTVKISETHPLINKIAHLSIKYSNIYMSNSKNNFLKARLSKNINFKLAYKIPVNHRNNKKSGMFSFYFCYLSLKNKEYTSFERTHYCIIKEICKQLQHDFIPPQPWLWGDV